MMRLPSRRSEIRSALFKMERCREMDGPEMEKQAAIWPAESSPFFSSCRIWRRVGSARARKARETDFILYNLAIWLIFVKARNLTASNLLRKCQPGLRPPDIILLF